MRSTVGALTIALPLWILGCSPAASAANFLRGRNHALAKMQREMNSLRPKSGVDHARRVHPLDGAAQEIEVYAEPPPELCRLVQPRLPRDRPQNSPAYEQYLPAVHGVPGIERAAQLDISDRMEAPLVQIMLLAGLYLGAGYLYTGQGRFCSPDGLRGVRMHWNDVCGSHADGEHVNFDAHPTEAGRVLHGYRTLHVYLSDTDLPHAYGINPLLDLSRQLSR